MTLLNACTSLAMDGNMDGTPMTIDDGWMDG